VEDRREFPSLKPENAALKSEIASLKLEVVSLKSGSDAMKSENAALKKELQKLQKTKTVNFTEEFLKEKETKNILKFYTGTIPHVTQCLVCFLQVFQSGLHLVLF